MSTEDVERYEAEIELQLYKEYKDVCPMFTYVVVVDPHYNVAIFSCGAPGNYTEYCNRKVTSDLAKSAIP